MNGTPDILRRILERKRQEVAERKSRAPAQALERALADAPPVRPFRAALTTRIAHGRPAVIAEVKRASPSKGVLRQDFDPEAIARSYAEHGASALSVLTDRDFFQGDDSHLSRARAASGLPVLRKDFVVDPYQVMEARVLGADCVLLIVAALSNERLQALYRRVRALGMDALVEVHDAAELERALALEADLIGINNRDLRNFETRLETTLDLLERIPPGPLVVTESGIHTPQDVARMRAAGVHAFLVGEAFMRAPDPGTALAALFGPTSAATP